MNYLSSEVVYYSPQKRQKAVHNFGVAAIFMYNVHWTSQAEVQTHVRSLDIVTVYLDCVVNNSPYANANYIDGNNNNNKKKKKNSN